MDDFDIYYDILSPILNKNIEQQVVYTAVRRYLRNNIIYSYISNIHIGIESKQTKINLLKPFQKLVDIENLPTYMIIEEHEFGIVYKNESGNKCFLWFEEIEKYCDGTLKIIKLQLTKKLKFDDKEEKKTDVQERKLNELVLEKIEKRLDFRNSLRRFYCLFGIRKRYIPPT
ncbi:hypothetical protein L6452_02342 [Arctium lappa]|uniref:Uncharacterized protein n=1 Tax=Arctium lappa TaxID=4217 RepID=A0ACB9FK67_ARCLA|nr:hypothetical protein L6452_02342 [Arctium lappa]